MKTPEQVATEAISFGTDFHGSYRVSMGEFNLNCFFYEKQAETFAGFARCELAKIVAADRQERIATQLELEKSK